MAKISDLKFDDRNANRGTPRGRGAIENSIQKAGFGRSILVDKHGKIIAGNKSAEVAGEIGIEDVVIVPSDGTKIIAVQRTDLDLDKDEEAKYLAIADNRAGQLSLDFDPEVLAELSQEIDLSDLWTEDELSALLTDTESGFGGGQEENEEDVDRLIEDAEKGAIEPRVKLGDLVLLGKHRLIVGDSTDKTTIERLMSGDKAAMCWTDPPYNVDYDPEQRKSSFSEERKKNPLGKIENDKMSDDEFRSFLDKVYDRINESMLPGCPIYISHADLMGHHFRSAFVAQPWKLQSCLIWKKTVLTFGRADYHWMHEPILYGWKEGEAHRYYGDRKQTSILEFAAPHYDKSNCDTDGYVHSCQKPTPLIEYCLQNSSQAGDIVLDLFGGSGSTLIACEKSDRVCYTCELDPRFATVIAERWERLTGKPANVISCSTGLVGMMNG